MPEATLARRIARYACGLSFADLPEPVVACVRRRFVDSLACILGAYGARPVEAAIAVAAQAPQPASTVFGTDLRTSPELAAFANGAMVRYLDYNDGYMGREPGHPSDSIPACLALAEAEGASGAELVTAIVVAYEVQMRLQDAASLNKRGWDHVNYINVAMAVAASRLMQLDEARTEQAINIALGAHLALRQVRSGTLSDWKGCSAANAARNALFAASLARHGMTGPAPVFEGDMGFFRQVTGTFELDVEAFGNRQNGDFAILRSLTKTFPTNGELHTAVWAAIDLRGRIADLDAIAAIRIETSEFNRRVLADAEKWRPATRETADHSLPYNVARALLDGDITLDSYSAERIADPRAIALMDITTVAEDPALTRLFPGHLANRVRVTLADGEELASEVIDGPGSLLRPMGDEDFERKFRRMAAAHIDRPAQDAALAFVAALESRTDYRPLFAAMRPRANPA
ncbi:MULTISPECIES: MmgE/PrpD family protein [unclassified Pseudomonas]|uniref:MmgE/PrpD family protein n=1 Tax=unclassified Pseudomonas TaxID=196821 RepID=UPI00244C67CF|nr:MULTISPECIES: MmgE/PrpD family protein [unclassified Pseudomonas]MDH0897169.1 MmgE/PrpD family protein [Pseudomonas sp. GD03875]MDH1067563.1 MmgE/PrpD family protein [Pseudomonas sp. GD03985]